MRQSPTSPVDNATQSSTSPADNISELELMWRYMESPNHTVFDKALMVTLKLVILGYDAFNYITDDERRKSPKKSAEEVLVFVKKTRDDINSVHTTLDSTFEKVDASTSLFSKSVDTIEKAAMEIKSESVLLAETSKELLAVKDELKLKIAELEQLKASYEHVSTQQQGVVVCLDVKSKELSTGIEEIKASTNNVDANLKTIKDLQANVVALEKANAELEQSNAQKTKEIEGLSHDLRCSQERLQRFSLFARKKEAPKELTHEQQRVTSP